MNSLVGTFEAKLSCSSTEAVWRIIGLSLLLVAMVAVVASVVTFFPYQKERTESIPILHGNHVEVSEILDGEVLVEGDMFLGLSEGNTTFIALGDHTISYMTKVDGISYRHNQSVHLDMRYDVYAQEIRGDTVVRILHKSMQTTWGTFTFLPVLVLLALLVLARVLIYKQHGTYSYPTFKSLFDKS